MNDTCPPDGCHLEQGFGENATSFYAGDGLKGHPGRDKSCGYGTTVLSPVSGVVSGTFTPAQPASDGYVAVFVVVETALETFEFCAGHLSEVSVRLGQKVTKGETVLGKEGNKGVVYAGGTLITLAMQAKGDKRGSHRHYQKRVVTKVKKRTGGTPCLSNSNGYYKTDQGQLLQWALPENGYNSCVDYSKSLFVSQLALGSEGYEVILLQRALEMPTNLQTGHFGPETQARLNAWQVMRELGAAGVVGPKTRDILNSIYGQLEDSPQPDPLKVIQNAVDAVANSPGAPIEVRRGILDLVKSIIKNLFT